MKIKMIKKKTGMWVVEHEESDAENPKFLCLKTVHVFWTTDLCTALWFVRECDAQRMADFFKFGFAHRIAWREWEEHGSCHQSVGSP